MPRRNAHTAGFVIESIAWPDATAFYAGWLRLGTLAVLLLPDARASHALLGWLPFWLLGVPALALLQHWALRTRVHPPASALKARRYRITTGPAAAVSSAGRTHRRTAPLRAAA